MLCFIGIFLLVGVCCEKFLFEIFEKSFVNLKIIKFIFFNFGFVFGRKWRLITHPNPLLGREGI